MAIRAPWSFRAKYWESRSDTTSFLFSLWKDASTTIDFATMPNWIAVAVERATGTTCTLATAAGPVPMKIWRGVSSLPDGQPIPNFRAGGEFALPGHPRVFVMTGARDSLTLLENLQILTTVQSLRRQQHDR